MIVKAFLEGANVANTVTIHRNYPLSCHASLIRSVTDTLQAISGLSPTTSVISTLPYYEDTLTDTYLLQIASKEAQGVRFQVHVHRGTSDVFLFYKGTAVFFHPQLRQHQQVPSLTEVRGWLLMANEFMHLTVYSYHHTIQGGGVIDCITNLLRSAGVHNLLCSEEKSYYM
ncbi:TPA: hypothetical protein ACH3X1_004987 [Trebouxia sp. C0004]